MNRNIRGAHGYLEEESDNNAVWFKDYKKLFTEMGETGSPKNGKLTKLVNIFLKKTTPLSRVKVTASIYHSFGQNQSRGKYLPQARELR